MLFAAAIPAASQQDYPPDSWDRVYISEYTLGDSTIEFVVSNENNDRRDISRWKVELIRSGWVVYASDQFDCWIGAHSGQTITVDWDGAPFDQVALLVTRDDVTYNRVVSEVPGNINWWYGERVGRSFDGNVWGWVID